MNRAIEPRGQLSLSAGDSKRVQVRVQVLVQPYAGQLGDATPAFGRDRWHVRLDGDTRTLLFSTRELQVVK